MSVLVLYQLRKATIPSNGRFGHTPHKANGLELVDAILAQARLWFFAMRSGAGLFEVRFVLVFALHLDPLAEIGRLGHVTVSMEGLVFEEFIVAFLE